MFLFHSGEGRPMPETPSPHLSENQSRERSHFHVALEVTVPCSAWYGWRRIWMSVVPPPAFASNQPVHLQTGRCHGIFLVSPLPLVAFSSFPEGALASMSQAWVPSAQLWVMMTSFLHPSRLSWSFVTHCHFSWFVQGLAHRMLTLVLLPPTRAPPGFTSPTPSS